MEIFNSFTTSENLDVITKLSIALLYGAILGLERVFAHRSAGPRTYALVSLGSALFVIISEIVTARDASLGVAVDSLRMASNIIIGVGFLGAGVIVLKDSTLTGLTTAAGLWVSAGIGVTVGFGYYSIGFLATLFTLLIFTGLWYIERGFLKFHDGMKDPGRE